MRSVTAEGWGEGLTEQLLMGFLFREAKYVLEWVVMAVPH